MTTPQQPGTKPGTQLYAHCSFQPGALRVELVGPNIEQREAEIIGNMICARIERHAHGLRFVVLDFSDIAFINSAGIGACVRIHNEARAGGATTILYGLNDELVRLFKMTKLDRLFKIVKDEKKLAKMIG
jgi:anti-anti-sigma factor